jgi:hypothetical protein
MRRVASVIFLILLAAGVWFGARWFVHRGELKATIIFDKGGSLRRGDPVLENGVQIGQVIRVDKVDDRTAVTMRLDRDHRRAIVSDSLFSVEDGSLNVANTFAVGAPVENGAIIHAREDRISRWLAKHGGAVKPYLDKARAKADEFIDRDFAEWTAKAPDWKQEGSESFKRHLDDARQRVAKAEADLRASNRADEARKLKERFEKWIDDVTR